MSRFDDVEVFWEAILSERAPEVLAAWGSLDAEERRAVEAHLRRMADPSEGFTPGQQESARFALTTVCPAAG